MVISELLGKSQIWEAYLRRVSFPFWSLITLNVCFESLIIALVTDNSTVDTRDKVFWLCCLYMMWFSIRTITNLKVLLSNQVGWKLAYQRRTLPQLWALRGFPLTLSYFSCFCKNSNIAMSLNWVWFLMM